MKWIPISLKYPTPYQDVLVIRKNGNMCVAYWVFDDAYINFPGDDCGWKMCVTEVFYTDETENELSIEDIHIDLNDVVYWTPLPNFHPLD